MGRCSGSWEGGGNPRAKRKRMGKGEIMCCCDSKYIAGDDGCEREEGKWEGKKREMRDSLRFFDHFFRLPFSFFSFSFFSSN